MKLLICTQVIDVNHPVLGFFHRWVEEFAKHYAHVHVICLYEGEHHLPPNVMVHSLGKESGQGRFKYLYRFYLYIWRLRHDYDAVFVHMNQIYVILGAPFWRATGKRIGLWYMHKSVTLSLRLAEKLTHRIFTASKESFRLPTKKLLITGHGIDTDLFKPNEAVKKDIDLITVGRISPAKNIEMSIAVLAEVRTQMPVTLTIIGGTSGAGDEAYLKKLKALVKKEGLEEAVQFIGPVAHHELPRWLQRSKVFLHTATNGSLDKTLLEALACGVPVVSSSEAAAALPLRDRYVDFNESMSNVVENILSSGQSGNIGHLREYVDVTHSLCSLIPKIKASYE